jgi:hypothetical protein
MFVLVLAAGSFLTFIAVLACLFIAHTLESREILRSRNIWFQRPATLLCVEQAFDPIYAGLWEAPMAALRLVSSARSGVSSGRLRLIFDRAAACFPEIYDGCDFMQWMEFLNYEELIAWQGNKVIITLKGKEFLANRFVADAPLETHSLDKSVA